MPVEQKSLHFSARRPPLVWQKKCRLLLLKKSCPVLAALCQVMASPIKLWDGNCKLLRPSWLEKPAARGPTRVQMLGLLRTVLTRDRQEPTLCCLATAAGRHLCNSTSFLWQGEWYSLHMLKLVNSDGSYLYKVGKATGSRLGKRFKEYTDELATMSLALTECIKLVRFQSAWQCSKLETRVHTLMRRYRPHLVVKKKKEVEVYTADALETLSALLHEGENMTGDQLAEQVKKTFFPVHVFMGDSPAISREEEEEVEEPPPALPCTVSGIGAAVTTGSIGQKEKKSTAHLPTRCTRHVAYLSTFASSERFFPRAGLDKEPTTHILNPKPQPQTRSP